MILKNPSNSLHLSIGNVSESNVSEAEHISTQYRFRHLTPTSNAYQFIGRVLLSLLIVLSLADAFASPSPALKQQMPELRQPPQTLKQQELEQLRQKIKKLQQDLFRQQGEKTQLEKKIKQSELLIADNARQLFSIQHQTDELKKKLIGLNQSVSQQNKKLFIQQQLLAEQIQTSYTIGRQEYLKLLLNQQNLSTISRVMTYYQYFNEARQQQIEQYNHLLETLYQDKQQVMLTSQKLREKQYQLRHKKQQLNEKQQQRNGLVTKLEKEIHSKGEALINLQKNEKNLTKLLKELKQTMDDANASVIKLPEKKQFNQRRGKLTWPVKGKVKKLFGRWRSVGKVKWQGIIIRASDGTAVHSVAHGRIAYSDWLRGYGLITIIDHGNGYMSLYGHNQTLLKEVGDWVETNEIIATVGSSGGLKKSGLYFEVRYNSKPSNPSHWCKKQRR